MAEKYSTGSSALLVFALLLCTVSSASIAQDERWYRVELLAFSQRGNELAEQWEPTPQLRYPEMARFLMRPDEVPTDSSEVPDTSTPATETGTQTGAAEEAVINAEDILSEPSFENAFVLLSSEQHELSAAANTMNRTGRYRVLFHGAWTQPVAARSEALPIILERSGDTGHWPALQGSIKLYLSRYLHLETNLWLNTNGDYLKGSWRMSPPPLAPESVLSEDGSALLAKLESNEDAAEIVRPDTDTAGDRPSNLYWLERERLEKERLAEQQVHLQPVYPFRHAALLQQKRRMRSKEVHYIDHPMLGLIIKLTPLETQELGWVAPAQ